MCRSIHTLYHVEPPANEEEIQKAALQFVRKISGFHRPSKATEAAFTAAVNEVTAASKILLASLKTNAPLKERTLIVDVRNE
jgi:hypothetical protein